MAKFEIDRLSIWKCNFQLFVPVSRQYRGNRFRMDISNSPFRLVDWSMCKCSDPDPTNGVKLVRKSKIRSDTRRLDAKLAPSRSNFENGAREIQIEK